MRFPHLPPGARFEFEGNTYVKTGPVSATAEDGSQRMIAPRLRVGFVAERVGDLEPEGLCRHGAGSSI